MIEKVKLIFIPCKENGYRPKFLDGQVLFYYAILILVLKISILPFFFYFPKSIFFAEITKDALIQFSNSARQSLKLPPLKENSTLNQVAYWKAVDMLAKDYFSHQTPEGNWVWDWLKKVGYNYKLAGENLAIGFLDSEEVHQAWLNSPSHRSNILNPKYQEIGIAVLKGEFEGSETTVVVQLFGSQEILSQKVEEPKAEFPKETKEKPVETIGEIEVLPAEISSSSPEDSFSPLPPEPLQVQTLPQFSIENPEEKLSFRFLKFMALNYNNIIQRFVYGSLIFVIIALLINIFVKIEIQHKDLILKTLAFIGLLILFIWLDKTELIQFIPHKLLIY